MGDVSVGLAGVLAAAVLLSYVAAACLGYWFGSRDANVEVVDEKTKRRWAVAGHVVNFFVPAIIVLFARARGAIWLEPTIWWVIGGMVITAAVVTLFHYIGARAGGALAPGDAAK